MTWGKCLRGRDWTVPKRVLVGDGGGGWGRGGWEWGREWGRGE